MRQLRAFRQPRQARSRQQPLLLLHVAALAALAPVELDELRLHFVVFVLAAERLHPGRRKLPVVVEPRAVFPLMQLVARHVLFSEMAHRLSTVV